jgi:hypothetical protein
MRSVILAVAVGVALAASAQAAPFRPKPGMIEFDTVPSVELVRDGCGRGWHPTRWRDKWGNWQWGDCVPNEGGYASGYGYHGRGSGWYYPHPDWRGVPQYWGWGNRY